MPVSFITDDQPIPGTKVGAITIPYERAIKRPDGSSECRLTADETIQYCKLGLEAISRPGQWGIMQSFDCIQPHGTCPGYWEIGIYLVRPEVFKALKTERGTITMGVGGLDDLKGS